MSEAITPTKLAEAAGISVPYASMILSDSDDPNKKRVPPLALAIKIFRTTGLKTGPIAAASDDDIEVMARVYGEAA
jgi:transcriptional regulator with XRE-family HTH domain